MGLRIAIFSAQYPPHMGGIETFSRNLATALAVRGNDVIVVTNDTNGAGVGFSEEAGFEVLRLPCYPLVDGRLPLPKLGRNRHMFLADLKGKEFDGVLVNARFYPHSLLGMKFARNKGLVPMVLDHGSAYLSFSNAFLDPIVQAYEHAITTIGKIYKPAYYGISQKSVEWLLTFGVNANGVINNSIDAPEYRDCCSARDFRAELELNEENFIVAFVGRFIPEKGIETIIEASRRPEIRVRHVVFALAGDGPMSDIVRAAEGVSLRCLGRLGKEDVSALLQQSDALCLPTRSEGFSTTLLEASACGCPSIVTDVGGAKELIPNEEYGTIISSASVNDLSSAIVKLADNPVWRGIQAKNCRKLVEERYSWPSTAALVEDALRGI